MIDEKPPIGAEEVAEATAILQKYKAGKAALDKRIVDNELWFRMGHWKNYQNPMMEGKPQPASGWLFNSIANKHADAMDNYPAPNVLPRAADDAQTAQVLSSILPVVLEQADYEQVYSDTWWRKLKQGTGVKGVFWDPEARGGVGEIAIRPMNLLMLYWEPGVADIQASPHFFSLSMENTKQLENRWPQLKGHRHGHAGKSGLQCPEHPQILLRQRYRDRPHQQHPVHPQKLSGLSSPAGRPGHGGVHPAAAAEPHHQGLPLPRPADRGRSLWQQDDRDREEIPEAVQPDR